MARGKKDNVVQSVMRAIDILESFDSGSAELGVSDISRAVGLHKSTVYGLLNTLAQRGYVDQDPASGKYRLGIKLFEMGCRVTDRMDLQTQAVPVLEDLVSKFQETVHLVVRDGRDVVYVAKRECARSVRIASSVGRRLPCYCTGVGKAMLSELSEEELDALYKGRELRAFTRNTITDLDRLKQELRAIRERGYSFDMEEFDVGVRCVAAAVKDHTGRVVGALSIAGPASRMTQERMSEMAVAVKQAARYLSRQLGDMS